MLLAGCTAAPIDGAPEASPTVLAPPQEPVLIADYEHLMGHGVGDNLTGKPASTGITPVGEIVEIPNAANVTRLTVTAKWTPHTPAARSLYLFLQEPGDGTPVLARKTGESPLVLEVAGPIPAAEYEVNLYPAPGGATARESVRITIVAEYSP